MSFPTRCGCVDDLMVVELRYGNPFCGPYNGELSVQFGV